MSESQKIAELRNLLTQLDQPKHVAEALPLIPLAAAGARAAAPAVAKGAASLAGKAKNAFQNFKRGAAGQSARTPAGTYTQAGGATKAGQMATTAGQAIKNNPVTALSTAATAGAAGQAALGGGSAAATKPTAAAAAPAAKPASDPAVLALQKQLIANGAKIKADGIMGPATTAAQKQFGTAPAAAALSTTEEGEMGTLAQELSAMMGQDPNLDALILQYQKLRPGAASAAP